MERDKIIRQINPCCSLPYAVMAWIIDNSISDENLKKSIINMLSHTGELTRPEWFIFLDSISLIQGTDVTIDILKGLLKCGNKCDFIKTLIYNIDLVGWDPSLNPDLFAPQSATDLF